MATVDDVYPVVSGEGFEVPVGWRSDPIAPSWISSALQKRGWRLDLTQLGESEVRFVDGTGAGHLPYPPIQLGGMEGVGSLPTVGFARMASDFMTYRRDRLSLQVIVTETPDSWARQWATYILESGSQQSIPLGSGVADERGAALHDGDFLIRATWWVDGVRLGPGELGRYAASTAEELLALSPDEA